jgi:hypothetical protein
MESIKETNESNVIGSSSNNVLDTNLSTDNSNPCLILPHSVFNPYKGNSISSKGKFDTTIIYQNINSLRPKTEGKWKSTIDHMESEDKWKSAIDRMEHLEADSVGLCETSVNWNNNKTRIQYSQLLQKTFNKSNLVASKLVNLPTKIHILGGCASITLNNMVNKIESSLDDQNKMGRWTGFKYRISKQMRLNITTAYHVIDQPVTGSNSLSSNSQQYHEMLNRGIENIKPRRQFIIDFCDQFEKMCHDNNQLTLLMIGANECTSSPEKDGILDLVESCGLVNIYQSLHDDREEFPKHKNGSKVIDYMFGSPNLLQYVHKVGYIKFHECFDSDHWGMFCDLSPILFATTKNDDNITWKQLVGSNSTNKEGINHAHNLNEQFLCHNKYERSEKLLLLAKSNSSGDNHLIQQLNEMDKFVTTSMINSDVKCCKKKDPVLWTPAVYQSNLQIQYYNARLKAKVTAYMQMTD